MCGIVGIFCNSAPQSEREHQVRTMATTLRHRGPNDSGDWTDASSGIALGQTRLSILDLSVEGHQPMVSCSGRYVITFNGEVYNFKALAHELQQKGHSFRGHSDTEVMLAAIEEWGVTAAVKHFNGMFAFALWDNKEKLLYLVRDRIGVKPLYYGWDAKGFYFASELKAIASLPQFNAHIDRDVVASFMRHCYVPAPHSIYEGFFKLVPGTILCLSIPQLQQRPSSFSPSVAGDTLSTALTPNPYWSAEAITWSGQRDPYQGDDDSAIQELETLLKDSIALRMIADVPLGAFLSGGIDSSLVVALMQQQSSRPVKTFTIGFQEERYNEAPHALKIAQHVGTDHTELYVSAQDCLDLVPRIPQIFDEPFADASQIPTYLVSQLARSKVTVCLSGDAGDELFGGYERYRWAQAIWNKIAPVPLPLRKLIGAGIQATPKGVLDSVCDAIFPFLPKHLRFTLPGNKLLKLGKVLHSATALDVYHQVTSHFSNPTELVLRSRESFPDLEAQRRIEGMDFIKQMMFLDLTHYLPDDILVKVDRTSMAVSLEAREPLMDYRLVEFASRLPNHLKIRGQTAKWILKQILYKYIPQQLFERPKMGFGVPIGIWLRGPLRDWAEALLDTTLLKNDALLNPHIVRKKWEEHLRGTHNWEYLLWDILMFQAWVHK